ncbi:hypothetical protein OSB04_031144 [Centaurea solstitialis]|uniref:Uncharacterized protein n=1 Tax=Centaurea solstitialis TaxID=347529 RepID=A0AA38SM34_9ASTR|nr:hypothetical protein OSB04_031144 [Centaurea solstitialis]
MVRQTSTGYATSFKANPTLSITRSKIIDTPDEEVTNLSGKFVTTRSTWIQNEIHKLLISLKLRGTNKFHHGFKLDLKILGQLLLWALGATNGIKDENQIGMVVTSEDVGASNGAFILTYVKLSKPYTSKHELNYLRLVPLSFLCLAERKEKDVERLNYLTTRGVSSYQKSKIITEDLDQGAHEPYQWRSETIFSWHIVTITSQHYSPKGNVYIRLCVVIVGWEPAACRLQQAPLRERRIGMAVWILGIWVGRVRSVTSLEGTMNYISVYLGSIHGMGMWRYPDRVSCTGKALEVTKNLIQSSSKPGVVKAFMIPSHSFLSKTKPLAIEYALLDSNPNG